MTTGTAETMPRAQRSSGASVLLGAGLGSLLLGLAAAGIGASVGGAPAAYGALVGSALVVVVFAFGAVTVHTVATRLPAASLLVALMTYALQLLLMLVVLSALDGSGAVGETLSRGWLAGAVICGALGWTSVQIALAARVRIPVYELPDATAGAAAAQRAPERARTAPTGGER
jgi:ATP synthase protein I